MDLKNNSYHKLSGDKMGNKESIVKSSILIMFFYLVSGLLGFVREMMIAAKFGSGWETDAYFVALSATGLITALVASSIKTTMIPIISEVETQEGRSGKLKHTNNYLNTVIIISIIFVIIGILIAPIIIKMLAMGFKNEQYELAVLLMRIGMPILLLKAIVGVYRGYLQSEQKFFESAISDSSFNIIIIIFLVSFSTLYGIEGLMVSIIFAVLSQLLVQIPGLRKTGYKYTFFIDLKNKYLKKLIYLVPPIFIGVAINDINIIVDKTIASTLVPGSVSSLSYAMKLNEFILNVFIIAVVTVLFPSISKIASTNDLVELKKITSIGFNIIILISIPATMGLIVLSYPIIEIAFQRGEFDGVATAMTSKALLFYSIGLVPLSLKMFYNNIYYSFQDTKTPMINGAISVVFNIIFCLLLVQFMEHAGLAFATSLSTFITTILLVYGLRRKLGKVLNKDNFIVLFKTLFSAIATSILAYYCFYTFIIIFPDGTLFKLINLIISLILFAVTYLYLLFLLKVEEIKILTNVGSKFLKKKLSKND